MRDARGHEGWIGAARVWFYVGREILWTTVSSHLDLMGVSAVSILSSLGIFCCFFWLLFASH
jgi:hypothetical protein